MPWFSEQASKHISIQRLWELITEIPGPGDTSCCELLDTDFGNFIGFCTGVVHLSSSRVFPCLGTDLFLESRKVPAGSIKPLWLQKEAPEPLHTSLSPFHTSCSPCSWLSGSGTLQWLRQVSRALTAKPLPRSTTAPYYTVWMSSKNSCWHLTAMWLASRGCAQSDGSMLSFGELADHSMSGLPTKRMSSPHFSLFETLLPRCAARWRPLAGPGSLGLNLSACRTVSQASVYS